MRCDRFANYDEYRIEYKFRFILRNLLAEKIEYTHRETDKRTDRQKVCLSEEDRNEIALCFSPSDIDPHEHG